LFGIPWVEGEAAFRVSVLAKLHTGCEAEVPVLPRTRWLGSGCNEHHRQLTIVFIYVALVVGAWDDVRTVIFVHPYFEPVFDSEFMDCH
jgi:hypothetical protein